jgi:hypothetical protein
MPRQRRRLLLALVILAAQLSPAAQAETATLAYQLVVHTTEVHALDVPGDPGHQVGSAAFRGLAIFADGRIAHHAYVGSFDFTDGAGPFQGYASWLFEDGSRLASRYTGEAVAGPAGGITFTGSHDDLTGTGAYAGVSGRGTFEGKRLDLLGDGGDTWQRGRLELELPDG